LQVIAVWRFLAFKPIKLPNFYQIKFHKESILRIYLKGTQGDKANTILAAASFNLRKMLTYRFIRILPFFVGVEKKSALF